MTAMLFGAKPPEDNKDDDDDDDDNDDDDDEDDAEDDDGSNSGSTVWPSTGAFLSSTVAAAVIDLASATLWALVTLPVVD
jgi:hypothetical protein